MRNRVVVRRGERVAVIFRVEYFELVLDCGAFHKEGASAGGEAVFKAREGLFDEFERAADDARDWDRHAAARDFVPENVDALETEFRDDFVQKVHAVRSRFAEREPDLRVQELERNSGESGAASDVDHACGPFFDVGVDEDAVRIVALRHRFERVETRQVLVAVVFLDETVVCPELFKGVVLKFDSVVAEERAEAFGRGLYALAAEERKIQMRTFGCEKWHRGVK